jgi:tetratricopeptide (TPR) repeat protein
MHRRAVILLAGLATLAVLGWFGVRMLDAHRTARQGIPPRPDLAGWPPALLDSLALAEQRAGGWRHPAAGLASLAALYHANGFYPEALACYDGLRRLEPHNARWPHLEAAILTGFGRMDEALPLQRKAVELAGDYPPARLRLADLLLKSGHPAEAAAAYAEALEHAPGNAYALLGLARCDLAKGDWQRARARLESAIAANPDFIGGLSLLVTVQEHLGDPAAAEELRTRIAGREFTDLPDPWLDALSDACFDAYRLSVTASVVYFAGDHAKARELLERAIILAPDVSSYRRQLAQLLRSKGEPAPARDHLAQAVAANPADADAWLQLVQTLEELRQHSAAQQALAAGLAHCPQSPSLHQEQARRLRAAGRLDEAIAEFRTSHGLRPSEAAPLVELANACMAAGRTEEGLAALQLALERQPGHPLALAALTYYYISAGDEAGALRQWQQVRAQPRTPPPLAEDLRTAFRRQFGHNPP